MKNVWLLVLACICMTACRNRQQSAEVTNYDLPQIKDSGELVVLTLNSSTSYFDYRGEPMGFQYELADQFARSLDVKLKIKVAQNARDLVHKLLQRERKYSIINYFIFNHEKCTYGLGIVRCNAGICPTESDYQCTSRARERNHQ